MRRRRPAARADLAPVSKTALGVARIRAAESQRPDRLFDDPYAERFVAAMPEAFADDATRSADARRVFARIALHVIIRTRFYDDFLLAATHEHGSRQVVLLAAGLDTRAFRLDWPPGTRVFEVDLPGIAAFKEPVLAAAAARCDRVVVSADLTGDWTAPLGDAGFDPTRPTGWLIEGLLVYLSYDDASRLLDDVARLSAPGSRLSCEQGRSAADLARQSEEAGASRATALWQGGLGEDVPGWLDQHGWRTTTYDLEALAAGYGRPLATESTSGFVIAERR